MVCSVDFVPSRIPPGNLKHSTHGLRIYLESRQISLLDEHIIQQDYCSFKLQREKRDLPPLALRLTMRSPCAKFGIPRPVLIL